MILLLKQYLSKRIIECQKNNRKTEYWRWALFLSESNPQKRKKSSIDSEVKFYRSFKIEKCGFSQFWYNNNLKFPRLIKLVRFVCCGPPTTVSSERIEYLTFLKRNIDREYEF